MTDTAHILEPVRRAAAERPIWIWGAGNQGRGIGSVLREQGVELSGFVDQAAERLASQVMGLPVRLPTAVLDAAPPSRDLS